MPARRMQAKHSPIMMPVGILTGFGALGSVLRLLPQRFELSFGMGGAVCVESLGPAWETTGAEVLFFMLLFTDMLWYASVMSQNG